MIPANAPPELLVTVTWPPGALAGILGPDTKPTLTFELEADATTREDVTVVVEPPPDDWLP